MDANKLSITTEYGDEMSIKKDFIATMETDDPVTLKLKDNSFYRGKLSASHNGSVFLKAYDIDEILLINVDQISEINPPLAERGLKISGNANVGGVKTTGNSDKQSFHADTEVVARGEKNRGSIGFHYNQGADDGKESENNTRINLKFDRFLDNKWYSYAAVDFTKDRFQDLDLRTSFGGGAGYQFIETDFTHISIEAGPTFVNEEFIEGESRDFISGRWAFKLKFFVFDKKYEFFHDHEGLFSSEEISDVLFRAHTGVRFPLLNKFNLSAQVDTDYDNKPSHGNQKADTRYIVGLGYSF